MKTVSRLAAALALGCAAGAVSAHGPSDQSERLAPWHEASEWPDRIVTTLEGDASRSLNVSWRTTGTVMQARAEIALALPDARFDQNATSVDAQTQVLSLAEVQHAGLTLASEHNAGLSPSSHHSVRFEGLEPDTLYAYRVQGAEGKWSEWFQTRTAPQAGPLRFIYLGDAQNGLDSHWPRVIRAAFQTAPDARFILHAGDLVNRGSRDLEWAEWFRGAGFIHGMIPAVPVAGNHEYERLGVGGDEREKVLSFMWRPQFRLPEAPGLPDELQETVYDLRYSQDLHVFVLNSNAEDMSVQARWLDEQLERSDARWRVVSMHHPVYSSGRDRDNPRHREVLLPVLLKHNVDLVLQGHDHTYARGTVPADPQATGPQTPSRRGATTEEGIAAMFVNSVSGPKQYKFSENGWDEYAPTGVTLDRMGENTQFYQVISIDGDELHYAAYTADGELYDDVRLSRSADGVKRITEALPPTRTFENTLPYSGVEN